MRIAVEARVLCLKELRGIGSYLCELLAAWPEREDSFVLLTPGPIPPERLRCQAQVEVVEVPEPRGSRFRVWDWWSMPRAVRRASPDLLWSPANQAVPMGGVPQVVTIHDTLLQEHVLHDKYFDRLFHNIVSPFWVRRYAKSVVSVSGFSSQRIQTVFSCEASRVRVIHNGASLPGRPWRDKEQAREQMRGKGFVGRPYVLSLGAESPWKNSEGTIRAFALVSRKNPDVDFVLAGVQKRAREPLLHLREQLGLEGRLRILDFLEAADRDALYQGAEVFVYPSLFEGFGLPPLEAMALGTPVVASDAASIPEVVGEAALLTDASDPSSLAQSILAVLGDPDLARGLVAAGRGNIERFKWEDSARAHRDLFKECLAP